MPMMMGSLSVPMNFKMEIQVSLTIVVVVVRVGTRRQLLKLVRNRVGV